jgi:hypothetical protein
MIRGGRDISHFSQLSGSPSPSCMFHGFCPIAYNRAKVEAVKNFGAESGLVRLSLPSYRGVRESLKQGSNA